MDTRRVLDAVGLASPRLHVVVHRDTLEVRAGDGGEATACPSLLAIERTQGAVERATAWGDAARDASTADPRVTIVNPFDVDASSRDTVLVLLRVMVAEVLSRDGGFKALRRATVTMDLQRPIAETLRGALKEGAPENEGIDLVIDGDAVPRLPRRRTREDLVLLVWRTLALAAFVPFAWWRYPQQRWAMIAVAVFAQILVVHEYTRMRRSQSS